MEWKTVIDDLLRKSLTSEYGDNSKSNLESSFTDNKSTSCKNPNVSINIGGDFSCRNFSVGNVGEVDRSVSANHTVKCRACGHIVARSAKSCPHCGQPVKTSRLKHRLIVAAMLLAPLVTGPPSLFGFIH